MKKLIEIVAKPIIRVFLVGFMSKDMIDGTLTITDAAKQKTKSICFENIVQYLKMMSVMHQKLGTLSWYSPL